MFSCCLIIVQNFIFLIIFVYYIILPRGKSQICICTTFFGIGDKLKKTSANDRKTYTDQR